jgi:formate hydrogenlyase subunit 4
MTLVTLLTFGDFCIRFAAIDLTNNTLFRRHSYIILLTNLALAIAGVIDTMFHQISNLFARRTVEGVVLVSLQIMVHSTGKTFVLIGSIRNTFMDDVMSLAFS